MIHAVAEIPLPGLLLGPERNDAPLAAPALRAFVAGPENRLAAAAISRFLQEEDSRYSPLVLVGPRGIGKSHLARGIAWRVGQASCLSAKLLESASLNRTVMPSTFGGLEACPTVVETSGGALAAELGRAIESDATGAMRQKYHAADLLVIDDLDRLASKRGVQSFLLHAIDEIEAGGGRVVATARQFPLSSENFSPALIGRFAAGLIVPIALPGVEAREIVLQEIAKRRGVRITDRAVAFLAQRFPADVPALDAAICDLAATVGQASTLPAKSFGKTPASSLHDRREACPTPVDVPQMKRFLAMAPAPKRPTIAVIVRAVGKHYALPPETIAGASRNKTIVAARGMAMYLARKLGNVAPAKIGRSFGGRDRTTVMHACQKIERLLHSDPVTQDAAHSLLKQLQGS